MEIDREFIERIRVNRHAMVLTPRWSNASAREKTVRCCLVAVSW